MNKLPFVSVTSRIAHHEDRVIGSWETNDPCLLPPVSIEIHLTGYCNANCPFFYYGSGSAKGNIRLSKSDIEKIAEEVNRIKVKSIVISGGGEPTVHPDFPYFVKALVSCDVEVGVITNGLNHSPSVIEAIKLCKWVKYSIHSHEPEIFAKMMGKKPGILKDVTDSIKAVTSSEARSVNVSIGCVVNNLTDTDEHIKDFFLFCSTELKADYVLYKPMIGSHLASLMSLRTKEQFKELVPTIRRMSEDTGTYSNYHTFVRDYRSEPQYSFKNCPIVWDGLICLISATGEVYGCLPIMQENNLNDSFGNIGNQSLSEIWRSDARINWLKKMDGNNCPQCKYPRMFSTMTKMLSQRVSLADDKKDQHWKFL